MIKCPNCGREISRYSTECPHCKAKLDVSKKEVLHEVNKMDAERKAVPVTIKASIPAAVICAIFSGILVWLPSYFEGISLGQFVGDNAFLASICAREPYGVFTLIAVNIVISIMIAVAFKPLYEKVRRADITMAALAIVGMLISCIGLLAIQVEPSEMGISEDLYYLVSAIGRQLPYYYGIVMTVFSSSALYAFIKLGMKKGLICTIVIFIIAMVILIIRCPIFIAVLKTGVNLIYTVIPAGIVAIFIVVTLILMGLLLNRKK